MGAVLVWEGRARACFGQATMLAELDQSYRPPPGPTAEESTGWFEVPEPPPMGKLCRPPKNEFDHWDYLRHANEPQFAPEGGTHETRFHKGVLCLMQGAAPHRTRLPPPPRVECTGGASPRAVRWLARGPHDGSSACVVAPHPQTRVHSVRFAP